MNSIFENLKNQLNELELLQSMFGTDDVSVEDSDFVRQLRSIESSDPNIVSSRLNTGLSYSVNIDIEGCQRFLLKVKCPTYYPVNGCLTESSVSLESPNWSRDLQSEINISLIESLEQINSENDKLCVVTFLVFRIQESLPEILSRYETTHNTKLQPPQRCPVVKSLHNDKHCRYWLLSHHIFSKIKRRDIMYLARDNELRGFMLPGKPGVICLEGPKVCCDLVWSEIKSWQWKKISHVYSEESDNNGLCVAIFPLFSEIDFTTSQGSSSHMDMGKFYLYLSDHDCSSMFKVLFGLEGGGGSESDINKS